MPDLIADMQNKVSELIAEAKEPLVTRIAELEAEIEHLLTRITQLREYRDQMLELTHRAEKYKWQRDECADELGRKLAVDYEYEATKPFAASDVIVDLDSRWEEYCK